MSAVNLQEILDTILDWKIQAISEHNDGRMKQYYLSLLKDVNNASHWPVPRAPPGDAFWDPGLARDEEFGF